MKSKFCQALWLVAVALVSFAPRPVAAQEPTIREVAALLVEGVAAGHFKCPVYLTVYQLLQAAGSAECPRKLELLLLARDCLCAPSREIDYRPGSPTYGQPFQTLGTGTYDLAAFWHTVAAQTFGRRLCALLDALIAITCPQ